MKKLLATALLAFGLAAPNPALAATYGEASFYFTSDSRNTVVFDIENVGQVRFGAVTSRMPQGCRGEAVRYLRDETFDGRYRRVPIRDYSALRDTLVHANRQGSQWAGVNIEICGGNKLLVCIRIDGGNYTYTCGVVQSRQ